MTDEAVVHLGVTTDASEAVAEVGRAFTRLEEILRSTGSTSGGTVGAPVLAALDELIATADVAGPAVEGMVAKIVAGTAKLGDIKGPATLGGNIAKVIEEIAAAGAKLGSTADGAVSAAIQRQLESLSRAREGAQQALESLRAIGAPQAAELERFLNPGTITRATRLAEPYVQGAAGIAAPTDPRAASLRQGLDRAIEDGTASEEDVAAANRALYKVLIEKIRAGEATAIGGRQYITGSGENATTERLPTASELFPSGDLRSGAAAMSTEEVEQLLAATKDEAEARRQNSQIDREDAARQREADQLLSDLTRQLAQIRKERATQEKAESAAYKTNTRVDTTAESDARKMAQLRDQAIREMQADLANRSAAARNTSAYTDLRATSGLAGIADQAPGFRDLSGGFVQLNNVLLKRTQAGLEEITAVEDMYRAEVALARQLQREAGGHSSIVNGSIFDAFLGGAFGHGFDVGQAFDPSHALSNLASTAGVLARYGYEFKLLQSAISGVTTSFKDLEQYQSVMVDLDEAIKATGADSLNLNLAFSQATSVAVGANDAYVIGTESLQAYQDELTRGVSANVIFQRSVEAVGQAMILTGQNAQQAQSNLLASTNSFGIGSGGQNRINDAVVNAVRNFGGDRGQVLTALSTSAAAGSEAGLDPEYLANLIALAQSRTGGSGSSIASAIDRIINRQNNGQFRQALAAANVQDTGDLRQEIPALSAAYKGMTASEQEAFTAALGGARNMQYLLPILRDGAKLTDAYAKSQHGAGAATDEAQRQLNTLGGQLKQVHALLGDILLNIGRSGVFTAVGLGIETLRPALAAVNAVLTTFNTLLGAVPGGHAFFGLALDVILLGKAIELYTAKIASKRAAQTADDASTEENTTVTQANNEAIVAGNEARAAADAAATAHSEALAEETTAIDGQTAALIERNAAMAGTLDASLAGGIGEIGPVVAEGRVAGIAGAGAVGIAGIGALLTNPITYAIAGLVTLGELKSHLDAFGKASDDATSTMRSLGSAQTPEEWKTAADSLKKDAEAARQAGSGIFGHLTTALFGSNEGGIRDQANYASFIASRVASESQSTSQLPELFGPTGHDVGAGLQAMKDQGISARVQLEAVAKALGLVKVNAESAAGKLSYVPGQATGLQFSDALVGTITATAATGGFFGPKDLPGKVDFTKTGDQTDFYGPGANGSGTVQGTFNFPKASDLDKKIRQALGPASTSGAVLSDQDKQKIADTVADSYKFLANTSGKERTDVKNKIRASVLAKLGNLDAKAISQQTGPIDDTTLSALLPNLQAIAQQAGQGNPLKLGSQSRQLSTALAIINTLKSRATDTKGTGYAGLVDLMDQVEAQYIQQRVNDLDRLRQAAEKRAGNNIGQIKSIRHDYFAHEIEVSKGSTTELVNVFDQMTQGEIDLFLAKYKEEVSLAREALQSEERLLQAIASAPNVDDVSGQKRLITQGKAVIAARDKYKQILAFFNNLFHADKNASPQDTIGSADSQVQAAQQAHLAALQAAADPRNPISQAQAALNAAHYQLSIAKKGSADYYNALKAVKDAQYGLAQAEQAQSAAAITAAVFPGSKLDAASAELKTARAELANAEKGTADWYKAMGDLTKAQVDYSAAMIEFHHNQRLLQIDITDPVATAREQVREDEAQLRADRRHGAPQDVITADKVKVKQDHGSAQQAAFSQKMQDEQTAFDLQEISASQYLSFLDRQRANLSRIKNKTRQQIDELNQVDEAIKGIAGQMNGQWNIGDIKIPTPYEARRYIQATTQGAGYQSTAVTNSHTTVNISGTDIGLVQKTLWQILGPSAHGRTTTGTRKA